MTQTPEQISKAAFDASENAVTAEQHLAAAELHLIAMEQGEERFRGGHQLAAHNQKLHAKKAAAKAAGNNHRAELIARGLHNSYDIGR